LTGDPVRFIDLQAQYARIGDAVERRVLDVLRGGQYILGPEVTELESKLAQFTGARHCVSCASGTDALQIALMAQCVGPGDAVFVPTFTFVATAEVVSLVGATPIFVDIDPSNFNLNPQALERAIQAVRSNAATSHVLPRNGVKLRPRGIIPVDLFGQPADYARINAIAAGHGLFVIEDAAQSFGATSAQGRAGTLAPVACASFFPAKPLGCAGDGGALFTDDDAQAALFRSVRVHGQGSDRYENVRLGLTGRLDSLQAAVLLAKLDIFIDELAARDRIAARYSQSISARRLGITTPSIAAGMTSAWAQYSILARDSMHRSACQASLKSAGIPSMIYYPKPLHLQTVFAGLGYRAGDFPVAEDCAGRILSLPMHPYLDGPTQDRVVAALV
jgi:UDP-2-acetamido-2-deoxy-ribo-hexuluronate aminotransferase